MFSLTDELVNQIEINGQLYDVDMSFDNVLRLIDMLNDKELTDAVQIYTGIIMLFGTTFNLPIQQQAKIFHEAYSALIGAEAEQEIECDILGNPMPIKSEGGDGPLYDFKQDAQYIYASFMQDYRIDLIEQQGKMHWYQFNALLSGLSEDTKFKKVLEIRQMELPSGKGTSKQREAVEKLKRAYALKSKE